MKHKKHKFTKMIYIIGIIGIIITYMIGFYIGTTKKAVGYSSQELLEALHWFQIADIFYLISGILSITVIIYMYITKNIK